LKQGNNDVSGGTDFFNDSIGLGDEIDVVMGAIAGHCLN